MLCHRAAGCCLGIRATGPARHDPARRIEHTGPMTPPQPRTLGTLVLVVLLGFCAVAVAVQAAWPEHHWWHAPLSFYLSGPHGLWLRAAYYGLAVAMVLLATGLWRTLAPAARQLLPPVLLACGGVALAVTATFPGPRPGHAVGELEAVVHGLSAIASFLFVGVAMLLQSASLHRDPHWRRLAWLLLPLAAIAFAGLWWHALDRSLPRGGSQKAVVALYLLWLGVAAWRLRSAAPAGLAEHHPRRCHCTKLRVKARCDVSRRKSEACRSRT